jgi:hypothetical protein
MTHLPHGKSNVSIQARLFSQRQTLKQIFGAKRIPIENPNPADGCGVHLAEMWH